ncbi:MULTISPECIES: cytochrome P450 [Kitasatospora]|uniref:Putative cytochrome P450 n=1 Tax=Kitasatospora setae (strain ATCC 33774 / DSM 43861 / JCM 3304 / KCC A-0304 / NBRC 14216 / KM-6054) TaxID=452652 RepID=E4MZX8_KITSK|nr:MULTISPECIES: cytochrome P450 [Kitasatospora]BAJ30062.1 putative cytochrome P450 [Kitasatospora setae KM-6054]
MTVPEHLAAGCPYPGRADAAPLYGPAVSDDPHGLYARLRAAHGPVAPIELEPGVEGWLVIGYQELLELTRNEQQFSKDSRYWRVPREGRLRPDSPLVPMTMWRPTLQSMDGAEHRRLSAAVGETLGRIDHRLLRETTEAAALALVESWGPDGTADLVAQFTRRLPLLVFTMLLDLPEEDGPQLLAMITGMVDSGAESQRAAAAFAGLLGRLVAERRARPGDDLVSWLLAHPAGLSDDEAVHNLVVLLVAGNESTINWIGNTVRLLLTDRRFRTSLTGGRATVADALDEVLWRDPPVQNFPGRWATSDTVLGGQYISAGDLLVLGLAGANDDPAAHGPEGLSGNRAHLAWGAGRHVCPAKDPARLIVETAVETLLHCLPDLQLAVPPHELTWRQSPWSRALVSLPVLYSSFTPPRPAAYDPAGQTQPAPLAPLTPFERTAWTPPPPRGSAPTGSTPPEPTSSPRTSGSALADLRRRLSSLAGWWSGR